MRTWLAVCAGVLLGLAGCGEKAEQIVCEGEDVLCGSSCVDPRADARHCGGCGVSCGQGEVCASGACRGSCPEGQAACAGGCHSLASSREHCGACDRACGEGEVCADTQCRVSCPEGQMECSGGCFALASSAWHCGQCGNVCGEGQRCIDGECGASCGAGLSSCGGVCRDSRSDPAHCGGCDQQCPAGQACIDGQCGLNCGVGLTQCGSSCHDLLEDRAHCGNCDKSCAADELCVAGACELKCGGLTRCGSACRDTMADRGHCGGCDEACGAGEHCEAGECQLRCGGFTPDVCDGACTNLEVDPANCGSCNHACGQGELCIRGFCAGASSCVPPNEVCDSGCTSTMDDPTNCGGCEVVCTAEGTALPVCVQGQCVATCPAALGDCDSDLLVPGGNGCETTLATSAQHCGACGHPCPPPPNATATCVASTCGLGQCLTHFGDCDGDAGNGCEADLRTSAAHCGACGFACPPGKSCSDGQCILATAEDCDSFIELSDGANQIAWTATRLDYMTAIPHCAPDYADPIGADIVLRYSPATDRTVTFSFDKPASTRWHVIITETCGVLDPEVACVSDWSPTTLVSPALSLIGGHTYYLHVVASDSGSKPLNNPLSVTVQ